jgi:arylsulfatase A-like enzyme
MKGAWQDTPFPPPNRTEDRSNRPAHVGYPDAQSEQTVRQHYAAMLENIDRHIGTLVDLLDQRGELDNTVIIYSADHGEMLGDFCRYNKGRPERGSAHIPLVVWGPGIVEGLCSNALVELQDLAATILDYAGSSMPEAVDSLSLRPVLEGQQTVHRPYQVAELKGWQMICDDRFKLVVERDGERLYDLANDPWENENTACEHRDVVARLACQLRGDLLHSPGDRP